MILNVTVDVNMDLVSDPANVINLVTEAMGGVFRTTEGVTSFQITRVIPEDPEPPLEGPASTTPEETADDV